MQYRWIHPAWMPGRPLRTRAAPDGDLAALNWITPED